MIVRKYFLLLSVILTFWASPSLAAPLGDTNGNGVLDLGDAIYILQSLTGLRQPSTAPYIQATVISFGSNPLEKQKVYIYTDSTKTTPITNATVTVNGTMLAYDATKNRYSSENLAIAAGATVNLSATIGSTVYTATGTAYTTFPSISAPTSGTTWQAARTNTITWTAGVPTAGASYLVALMDSTTGNTVYPAGNNGPLEVLASSNSFSIPADSITAGSYQVLVGIGTTGITNNTGGIPIANAAPGSGLWVGGLATYVPVLMTAANNYAGTYSGILTVNGSSSGTFSVAVDGYGATNGIVNFNGTTGTSLTGQVSTNGIVTFTLSGKTDSYSGTLDASTGTFAAACTSGCVDTVIFTGTKQTSSVGTASGTYTLTSTWYGANVITWNWTSSDFPCEGPDLGTGTDAGATITATTMAWANDNLAWTRASGTAGDILGTWTATDSTTGDSYTLTFNANGTVSVTGVIVQCGDGDGGSSVKAEAQHWAAGYHVQLRYSDPSRAASSVSVTGPGITGSVALAYNTQMGSWGSGTPESKISFGTTYPAGMPYTYTFSITDATTWTATSTVSCFQEQFPTNISPTGTVSSGTPTFSWTGINDPNAVYGVQVNDSVGNWLWADYFISGTSIVYNGPALIPGMTYGYVVSLQSSSACSDQTSGGGSYLAGSFTYQ